MTVTRMKFTTLFYHLHNSVVDSVAVVIKNTFTRGEESKGDRHSFSGGNTLPHISVGAFDCWANLCAYRLKLLHFHAQKIVDAADVVVVLV